MAENTSIRPQSTLKLLSVLAILLAAIFLIQKPLAQRMTERPFVTQAGLAPHPAVLRLLASDQKELVAAWQVFKVLIYFGTSLEEAHQTTAIRHDFEGMNRLMQTVTRLDPYNMDAYYFAQAVLVWDLGRIDEANALLEYGMQHRTWDHYLPFFAGFNAAYFMKDYDRAARYYQRAGELLHSDLFVRLTSRYLYEAGKTELAITYLKTMRESTENQAIRQTFDTRLAALEAVHTIEQARDRFIAATGKKPVSIDELYATGQLTETVSDPYGGSFSLDDQGQVRTTSKFATGQAEQLRANKTEPTPTAQGDR